MKFPAKLKSLFKAPRAHYAALNEYAVSLLGIGAISAGAFIANAVAGFITLGVLVIILDERMTHDA